MVAAGMFISVYGNRLFRFALAAMGFGLGFLAAMSLFEDQEDITRVLIALAAGGVVAFLLFSLVKFSLYIAGGILGLVAGLVVVGVIGIFGPDLDGVVGAVIAAAGTGLGAFFGRRLGSMVVLLASAAGGAFLIINGLEVLFNSRFDVDTADPTAVVSQKLTLVVFAILFGLSALSQYDYRRFRQRVLH